MTWNIKFVARAMIVSWKRQEKSKYNEDMSEAYLLSGYLYKQKRRLSVNMAIYMYTIFYGNENQWNKTHKTRIRLSPAKPGNA